MHLFGSNGFRATFPFEYCFFTIYLGVPIQNLKQTGVITHFCLSVK